VLAAGEQQILIPEDCLDQVVGFPAVGQGLLVLVIVAVEPGNVDRLGESSPARAWFRCEVLKSAVHRAEHRSIPSTTNLEDW
jgi:hypothetical protein